jgi:hypothetical protein
MVAGAPLLLAALASAPVSTYEQPVCDARTSLSEEELSFDAPIELAGGEPADQSVGEADDCAPEALPPVVDCNDERMSVWVQEMIGSCDMPRSAAALRAAPRPDRPAAACDGSGCGSDRTPVRAAVRAADPSQSLDATAIAFALHVPSVRIALAEPARLRSAPSPRLERPPRKN